MGLPPAPRVGNPRVGAPHLPWGASLPPWPPPPPLMGSWPAPPLPGGLYKGGREGSDITALGASLLPCYTSPSRRSSAKPCRDPLHPPPRRCAAGSPSTSPSPCWIKKEETSLHHTCVERGGAVRSALGHRRFGSRRVRLRHPRSLERLRSRSRRVCRCTPFPSLLVYSIDASW